MAEFDTAINSWVSRCMDDAGYPHLRPHEMTSSGRQQSRDWS